MYVNINALYKVTFIFSGKNRFNVFNIPTNLEHLIEIFLYEHPSLGFLARLPQEDYNFGLFLLRFHLF